ncbi:MAG TPA: PQQ-binding-like beta-propeller repeat protein [Streptosporangiaceae bacterium]
MEPLRAADPRQIGVYRLRARLGSGGMGQVFLGYSPAGRAVAVKVIHRELAGDPEFRTRFRREVAAASAVSGAYTAPVVAAGPDDDPPWLATVFVPGPSLAEAVATAGPLPPPSVWKLAAGLVEALEAVHSAGLVHRDLKPANILLALDGPRVIDFGISRALEKTAMTSTGMIVGTPSFMSPEQAEGSRAGPPSDVFSLGGVIVFAATGAGPFGHGPQASMLYRVVHAKPELAEVPGGPRELAAACLAKAPAERPGLAALAAAAAGRVAAAGDELSSFWPVAVTGLIRTHQARVATEVRDGLARLSPPPRPAGEAGPPGGTAVAPPTAPLAPSVTAAATRRSTAAEPALAVIPGPTAVSTDPVPGPALPADRVTTGPPGGGAGPGLTRRRVFVGLAVLAGAGLAGAGWDLSQAGAAQPGHPAHPASGIRPRAAGRHGPAAQPGTSPPQAGGQRWAFPAGGVVTGIALAGGRVFAGSADFAVYGLRASDGRRLWAFRTGGPVQSRIAVAAGIVYAGGNDNHVYALDTGTGRKIWAFATGGSVASVIAVAGGAVYAGSGDETLYALRVSDGQKLWGASVSGVNGIAVADGVVYAAGADDMVHALRASTGGSLWTAPTGIGGTSQVTEAAGVVYAGSGDGRLHALRAGTGGKLWDFPADGAVQSQIAVAGGAVCFGTNGNKVYAVGAGSGRQRWVAATNGPVTSGIAVAGGIVYAGGNDGTVRALRVAGGSPVWSFSTAGPVASQIAVANGTVYAGSNDGSVYALAG